MKYLTAVHTERGFRKKKNQDSITVMEAETGAGNILLASVCDGMGGLDRGETASAAAVHAFREWFTDSLPGLVKAARDGTLAEEKLYARWTALIERLGCGLEAYGRKEKISLGTTAVALLLFGKDYYTLNVGDSRAYLIADTISLLTKDQTYVQQEMDAGRMTYAQSLTDPRQGLLLQCVGAGIQARPAFRHGKMTPGQVFLLCSDGFRHVITREEIYRAFSPLQMTGEDVMKQRLTSMTDLIMERGERDNISAVLVRTI